MVTFDANEMHGERIRWRDDGSTECKTLFDHGAIQSAECWSPDGAALSESEALKSARRELEADDEWFQHMDSEIERSLLALPRR